MVSIAAITWGSVGLVVRFVDLPIASIILWRVLFASAAIALGLAATGRLRELKLSRRSWPLIGVGLLLSLHWLAFFSSVRIISMANAVLITYLSPVFVAVAAPFVLKERFDKTTAIALLLALTGTIVMVFKNDSAPKGDELIGITLAIIAALTYASLVLIAKPMMRRFPVSALIFYEELVVALALAPFALSQAVRASAADFALLAMLGIVQTAFSAWIYLEGLKRIPAARAAALSYLDPVSAAIFAAIFLKEIPNIQTIAGGALILCAGYLVVKHGGEPAAVGEEPGITLGNIEAGPDSSGEMGKVGSSDF